MIIPKKQLRRIIKEELAKALEESREDHVDGILKKIKREHQASPLQEARMTVTAGVKAIAKDFDGRAHIGRGHASVKAPSGQVRHTIGSMVSFSRSLAPEGETMDQKWARRAKETPEVKKAKITKERKMAEAARDKAFSKLAAEGEIFPPNDSTSREIIKWNGLMLKKEIYRAGPETYPAIGVTEWSYYERRRE